MKHLKRNVCYYLWNAPRYNILDFIPQLDYNLVTSSVCLTFYWNYITPSFRTNLYILPSRKIKPIPRDLL